MDGTDRTILVNRSSLAEIGWPNGLSVDFETDLIYWTDAKANALFRMDINGGISFSFKGPSRSIANIFIDLISNCKSDRWKELVLVNL